MTYPRPLIDAHLDLAWNALQWNRDLTCSLDAVRAAEQDMADDDARGNSMVTLPELRRAAVTVCLATVLVRAKPDHRPSTGHSRRDLDVATQDIAFAIGWGQLAYYHRLEQLGEIRLLRTAADLQRHWQQWAGRTEPKPIGVILAMEGADPISEPSQAQEWCDAGLRAVSLAHYGAHPYAHGTGGDGPLTKRGHQLLAEFDRLGMILDLTHTADLGFFEALDVFAGRVFASHNNCRSLVPGDRQFSDEQIRRIAQRDGVLGIAFDAWMLMPGYEIGGTPRSRGPLLGAACDHIDHICQLTGSARHVAIGSDLDGGFGTEQAPQGLESVADLQKLAPMLQSRGYSDEDINLIFHGNWLRFFSEALPPGTGESPDHETYPLWSSRA